MSDTIKFCKCGNSDQGQNYGTSECLTGVKVIQDLYFMNRTKEDGTPNNIKASDTIDEALFDGFFKNPIYNDRWLPVKGMEDIVSSPAESNKFTYPSGREVILSNGIRLFVAIFPVKDPNKFVKKFKNLQCRKNLGIMFRDSASSLVGQTTADSTTFESRGIIDGTLDARAFDENDTTDPRVELSFQYTKESLDGDVDYILKDSMGGYDLQDAEPLIDANITIVESNLADIIFDVFSDFSGYSARTGLGGLGALTLDVHNNTTAGVEATSSITESASVVGRYTGTYTAPVTIADLMEVRGILAVYVQLDYDLKRLIGVELAAS